MIDEELVAKVAAQYAAEREHPECQNRIRDAFPHLRITFCSDDEIGKINPALQQKYFNIYLFGGTHCLALTTEFDGASGIVIAEVVDDDE